MSEAPRWRLTSAHYLKVPVLPDGTRIEWEHKETARETGRTVRKLYAVPMLLDPKDSADCNYPGEIIVTHDVEGSRTFPRDYIFEGEPTQEMEPLNAEAEAVTESLRDKWIHPIDSLPANGGMNAGEQAFMAKMMEAFAKEIGASMPKANAAIADDETAQLRDRVAKLEAFIAEQQKAKATEAGRRV